VNYYEARQRTDGRWDWTRMNDRQVWPDGYCHAYREWTPEKVQQLGLPAEVAAKYEAEQAPFRAKYHADGHPTREEAERCHYEYELDHAREGQTSDQQFRCRICKAWTQSFLQIGDYNLIQLCDEHRNRAGLEQAWPFSPGMRVMSS
jgi:hypothetical protein